MDQVSPTLLFGKALLTKGYRNIFEGVKFNGVMRLADTYQMVGVLFKILQTAIPSIGAKRAAYLEFTRTKIESRLDRKTDRKDFMTYASFSSSHNLIFC